MNKPLKIPYSAQMVPANPAPAVTIASRVTLPVAQPIAAGSYKITYRVVSADSHPISGATTFTVASTGRSQPSRLAHRPSVLRRRHRVHPHGGGWAAGACHYRDSAV